MEQQQQQQTQMQSCEQPAVLSTSGYLQVLLIYCLRLHAPLSCEVIHADVWGLNIVSCDSDHILR